jgi:hypothetical protein
VFERALDVDPRSTEIWIKYTDMELKARNINHARNLFDRGITLLPRVDAVSQPCRRRRMVLMETIALVQIRLP